MRYRIILVLLSILFSQASYAKWVGLDSSRVDGSFEFQETPVWCWAATIQMTLNYYGFDVSQDEIVTRTFGASIPTTGNWMQMTNNLNYRGQTEDNRHILVSASVFRGSPSSEVIINHLKQEKPIIMAFNNPGTFSGHAILITGVDYSFIGNRARINSLIIRDPFPYNPQHVAARGRVTIPNNITPTHMWLIDATLE